jgi:hypothetical protein
MKVVLPTGGVAGLPVNFFVNNLIDAISIKVSYRRYLFDVERRTRTDLIVNFAMKRSQMVPLVDAVSASVSSVTSTFKLTRSQEIPSIIRSYL